MSQTLTLQGYNSILSVDYYPPIELDTNCEYCIALLGFHTYNSIPNVDEKNNKLILKTNTDRIQITIPIGAYEISDIETYLKSQLGDDVISLKPNNNTLKCEIKCKYSIDFADSRSALRELLGYSPKILEPNILHQSDLPVNIRKVSSIRIECNIASGAYFGNKQVHTIYQFSPVVDPGFSLDIEPRIPRYLKVNAKQIDNLTLCLYDQNGELINFNNEHILIILELKKC